MKQMKPTRNICKYIGTVRILFNRFWECHLRSKKVRSVSDCEMQQMQCASHVSWSSCSRSEGFRCGFAASSFGPHHRVFCVESEAFRDNDSMNQKWDIKISSKGIIHEVWVGCILLSTSLQGCSINRKQQRSCWLKIASFQCLQGQLPTAEQDAVGRMFCFRFLRPIGAWQVPSPPNTNIKWFMDIDNMEHIGTLDNTGHWNMVTCGRIVARLFMDLTFSLGRKATCMQECPVPRGLCKDIQKETTKQQEIWWNMLLEGGTCVGW